MSEPPCIDLARLLPDQVGGVLRQVTAARLVCFPTDTVYGVGGAARPAVVETLVAAKGRDAEKPLQVVFPTLALLEAAVRPGPRLRGALRRLLPGAVTLVVPYPAGFEAPPPGRGPGGEPTLGVRVPRWPPAAGLLAALPVPLVASSANASGAAAPRSLDQVSFTMRAACDLLLDAGPLPGQPSTVVDLCAYEAAREWRILREGALKAVEVAALLEADGDAHAGEAPPGRRLGEDMR